MTKSEQLQNAAPDLFEALKAAWDHLEYCGYGDSWERECARESKLPDMIHAALVKAGYEEPKNEA